MGVIDTREQRGERGEGGDKESEKKGTYKGNNVTILIFVGKEKRLVT